ncbi:MAG: hypothetical protein MUO64_14705 [Anaerolineales bacterium]|nr:hypothetical protein [Anaerolineales bacterium]
MTEKSWPWSTVAGLGDGSAELNEALSREFLALYFGVQDPAVEGVCKGLDIGELEVTGVASPLSVDPGAGICYGLYVNDAVKTLAVSTPAVGTTGGRVVLQTNWAGTGGAGLEARTRLAVKGSADGNPAIPGLTQAFGTTWEISLATFTITTAPGVITVTDDRTFRRSTSMVDTDEIANLAVETGKINNLAVTTAKIDNLAVTAGKIGALAVETAKINNLAVTLGKIDNDAVDDTKAGNRVPQFYRRQGGNATHWSIPGANNYTPTAVRMQGGQYNTDAGGDRTITFPVAFSATPIVIVTSWNDGTGVFAQVCIDDVSATTFAVESFDAAGVKHGTIYFNWFAFGAE